MTTPSNGNVAALFGNSVPVSMGSNTLFTNTTLPTSSYWSAIAWNGTVFCAIAGNATTIAATSPDGITWTQRTLPTSTYWTAITWNGTVFCAIAGGLGGTTSIAATSPDGITWTQRTLPSSQYWTAITWNGTVFCTIAGASVASNIAATSPDGITWTQQTLPSSQYWSAIAWNGTVFCAVAGWGAASNVAATSPDGITWTQRTISVSAQWSAIAWNGTVFCAIAGAAASNIAATSPDGISWTQRTLPSSQYWSAIAWNGGAFCAITGGQAVASNTFATSQDGINWIQQTSANNTHWSAITTNNTTFCAVGGIASASTNAFILSYPSASPKVIQDVTPTNTSSTPSLYGGCSVIDLLARNSDQFNHDIQLYTGTVTTTLSTPLTGAVSITTQNTITRAVSGNIADGWHIGDLLMFVAPTANGSAILPITGVEGIACVVTNVTDTVLTVSGTPLTNATVTAGYRICKVAPHYRTTIPAYSGVSTGSYNVANTSLLNNSNDNSFIRNEIKLGINDILIAIPSDFGAVIPNAVSLDAIVAYY